MKRPGPLPSHGQPPGPSLLSLFVIGAGVAGMVYLGLTHERRLILPPHRRLRAAVNHRRFQCVS